MSAYRFTYAVPLWEREEKESMDTMENEHREKMIKEVRCSMYEDWRLVELHRLYDDIARHGKFVKFYYNPPSFTLEKHWAAPHFRCADPLGLFYQSVDEKTFHTLQHDIFKIKRDTIYHSIGSLHLTLCELKSLFCYAEDWCEINLLYEVDNEKRNYKFTVWVVSRMIEYMAR